jgi:Late exocytosis, associated with Golgi transport
MDNSTAPPAPPATLNCTDDSVEGGLCYQIVPSSQLKTSLWVSFIGGVLCLIAFAFLRGHKTWKPIYHKRATQISDLLCRPAPLLLGFGGGLQRIWSYLTPALTMSDTELLATAGLDTLILIRFIQMGIQMFFPSAIIGCAVLLPLYHTGGALENQVSKRKNKRCRYYSTII